MNSSDRLLRWLCWGLIGFTIVSALFTLTLATNPFATPVADNADFVDRLLTYRGDDQKVYGLVQVGSLATIGVYLMAALIAPVLRRFASPASARDHMVVVFLIGSIIGVAGQLMNIAVAQAAANGYCDCGYKNDEVISQAYALDLGWIVQNWLNIGAVTIVGLGAAIAGRIVSVSRDWMMVSFVIAVLLLAGVVLRLLGVDQLSNQVVGLTAGIGVPIWAYLLARGSGKLAAQG